MVLQSREEEELGVFDELLESKELEDGEVSSSMTSGEQEISA
jgi:hypothetical protein